MSPIKIFFLILALAAFGTCGALSYYANWIMVSPKTDLSKPCRFFIAIPLALMATIMACFGLFLTVLV